MRQQISKKCFDVNLCVRQQIFYNCARQAFGNVLDNLEIKEGDSVLLPGYIGWSPKEGSGVFDPIKERKISPIFYRMGKNLCIDVEDCKKKIEAFNIKILLVIHYFGFVDDFAKEIIMYAKKRGIIVIEDAAHAMLTDKIKGGCGRDGDYTLYSLHKMLPYNKGGILVKNNEDSFLDESKIFFDYEKYDLYEISQLRINNYNTIKKNLDFWGNNHIRYLRAVLPDNTVPQSFPVILHGTNRDKVYEEMNECGWGVVSLYHTMINELQNDEFQDECWLAKHITNLPVHQDIDSKFIETMIEDFVRIVNKHVCN